MNITSIEIKPENSTEVYLTSSTKTTPIMDKFFDSEKKYLIFKQAFTIIPGFTRISLIVAKSGRVKEYRDGGMTATNLKEHYGQYLDMDYYERYRHNERMFPLWDELFKINEKRRSVGEIVPLETPCMLNAQTKSNQSGYGSIYYGEQLLREGTLYGETTPFAIIAVRIDA